MEKIISLYQRNYDGDRLVRDEIVPGAEWVVAGEGVATRKFDGTACLVRDGHLYKRYDARRGKTPPPDFVAAQEEPDAITGHWPGWVPVTEGDPSSKWHYAAWVNHPWTPADGTYELCGPHVQGNPEGLDYDCLIAHGNERLIGAPRDYEGLRDYLTTRVIEGIVWHHPDGRMVKIKASDFGLKWPRQRAKAEEKSVAEQPNQISQEMTKAIAHAINVASVQVNPPYAGLHGVAAQAYGLPGMVALTLPDGTVKKLTLRLDDMPRYGVASL